MGRKDARESFGGMIRRLRTERGLSQADLARTMGVKPAYLCQIESGRFPPPAEKRIVAMAEALGENPVELLAAADKVASQIAYLLATHAKEALIIVGAFSRATDEQRALLRDIVLAVTDGDVEVYKGYRDFIRAHKGKVCQKVVVIGPSKIVGDKFRKGPKKRNG